MLRKDTPFTFERPTSAMRQVLNSVEVGNNTRHLIASDTGLNVGKVQAALWNLSFIGAVKRSTDDNGRSVYSAPGCSYGVATCWKGVSSIFKPFTRAYT